MKLESRATHARQHVYENTGVLFFTKTDIAVMRGLLTEDNSPTVDFETFIQKDYVKAVLRHLASSITFLDRIGVIDLVELNDKVTFTVDVLKIKVMLDFLQKTSAFIRVFSSGEAKFVGMLLKAEDFKVEVKTLALVGMKFDAYATGCLAYTGDTITLSEALLSQVKDYKEMLEYVSSISHI
jgi:hypothetical protein